MSEEINNTLIGEASTEQPRKEFIFQKRSPDDVIKSLNSPGTKRVTDVHARDFIRYLTEIEGKSTEDAKDWYNMDGDLVRNSMLRFFTGIKKQGDGGPTTELLVEHLFVVAKDPPYCKAISILYMKIIAKK